jgi:hypothetical protein
MTTTTSAVNGVYKAIHAVQVAIGQIGIAKGRRNQQQGFMFRGIDDIYNAMSPLLAEHGLMILPRMVAREHEERATAKGGTLHYVTVAAEFDFIAVEDGTLHVCRTYGEAMDSADKATNKAMSAAYKYACMQAFAIPTEAMEDADATTPEPSVPVRPSLTREQSDAMGAIATEVVAFVRENAADAALECVQGVTDDDEKRYLWWMLGHHQGVQEAIRAAADQQPKG